jgi:hypothetical protein
MACSTRRAALLAATALLPGCVTGHLVDAARRRERPVAVETAALDRDRLLLAYTALVTDDLGARLGRRERRAAVALADIRRGDTPVEDFPVERLPDAAPFGGRSLPLRAYPDGTGGQAPALLIERAADGRLLRLAVSEGGNVSPPVAAGMLGRESTAPWVWPLLPIGLAVDAVVVPVLLFFAPAVILMGD